MKIIVVCLFAFVIAFESYVTHREGKLIKTLEKERNDALKERLRNRFTTADGERIEAKEDQILQLLKSRQ